MANEPPMGSIRSVIPLSDAKFAQLEAQAAAARRFHYFISPFNHFANHASISLRIAGVYTCPVWA